MQWASHSDSGASPGSAARSRSTPAAAAATSAAVAFAAVSTVNGTLRSQHHLALKRTGSDSDTGRARSRHLGSGLRGNDGRERPDSSCVHPDDIHACTILLVMT